MKKGLCGIITLLLMLTAACFAGAESGPAMYYAAHTGSRVAAVFAAADIQPWADEDGETDHLDSIWVYYTDGTFEQFAEMDDRVLLFSSGSYELPGNADFISGNRDGEKEEIVIRREKKYAAGKGLADYQSEHTYELGTLGFTQLYAGENPERQVKAIFYGIDKQPYTERDGDREMLDTWWIYYTDGSFEQYAVLEDKVVLFSEGTYTLGEGSSFVYEKNGEGSDRITIQRTKKYQAGSLAPYESSHEYELGTLGLVRIYAIDE